MGSCVEGLGLSVWGSSSLASLHSSLELSDTEVYEGRVEESWGVGGPPAVGSPEVTCTSNGLP